MVLNMFSLYIKKEQDLISIYYGILGWLVVTAGLITALNLNVTPAYNFLLRYRGKNNHYIVLELEKIFHL